MNTSVYSSIDDADNILNDILSLPLSLSLTLFDWIKDWFTSLLWLMDTTLDVKFKNVSNQFLLLLFGVKCRFIGYSSIYMNIA